MLILLFLQDLPIDRLFKDGDLETRAVAILTLRTTAESPLAPAWRAPVRATVADILKLQQKSGALSDDPLTHAIYTRALLEIYPRPGASVDAATIQKALDHVTNAKDDVAALLKPAKTLGFKTTDLPDAKIKGFLTDEIWKEACADILDPKTPADERRRLLRDAALTAAAADADAGGGRSEESAVSSSLRWLSGAQNDDGSWGDGAADTSLVLLSYLGAGYTHLSKDRSDGIVIGDVVKAGLKQLRELDPSLLDARSRAIRALALAEIYGLTGSALFKQPAQDAADGLEVSDDLETLTWTVMAAKSADLAELETKGEFVDALRKRVDGMKLIDIEAFVKKHAKSVSADVQKSIDAALRELGHDDLDVRERASDALRKIGVDAGPSLLAARASPDLEVSARAESIVAGFVSDESALPAARAILARRFLGLPADADLVRTALSAREKSTDPQYWYWAGLGLFMLDGPTGETWKSFNPSMKEALLKTQSAKHRTPDFGSWDAPTRAERLRRTSLSTLSLEVYYRYANIVGADK